VPINASPSLPVLGFALAVSFLTGILFGVAPAWLTAHSNPVEALRGANRSTENHGGWAQKSLVVLQAALSLVLLCAAGLLTRSLSNMQHQDFGFVTTNRYIAHVDPQMAGYKPGQLEALYHQLRDNVRAIPGVKQVSFSLYSPMEGDNWGEGVFIEGEPPPAPGTRDHGASWLRAGPNYFDTVGTKIVKGRANNEQDTSTTRNVAVVNRFFEKKYFKDGQAIGKHFSDDVKHPGNFEIVGVTEDTHYWGPSEPMRPMYFLAQGQTVHSTEPRYQQFEDRSQYLNAIEIETPRNFAGEPRSRGDRSAALYRTGKGQLHAAGDDREADIVLRSSGAGAGLYRALRRDGLLGGTAHERDWHPDGAGRRSHERDAVGSAWGLSASGHWPGNWHAGGDTGRSRDGKPVVWDQAL
jgi:putative ABC transport system permease protein